MASGFQANSTALAALLDKSTLGEAPHVFADRLNHASMHFGCKAGGVRQQRYKHLNNAHLEQRLAGCKGEGARFILSETVFSMDGDRADMLQLSALG